MTVKKQSKCARITSVLSWEGLIQINQASLKQWIVRNRRSIGKLANLNMKHWGKMEAWEVVERNDSMNFFPGTWVLRKKRSPDGTVKKYKSRFFVRGDKQIDQVDFFVDQLYSSVCNWSTISLMSTLSIVLNLVTVQVDYTSSFVQEPIKDEVFV